MRPDGTVEAALVFDIPAGRWDVKVPAAKGRFKTVGHVPWSDGLERAKAFAEDASRRELGTVA